MHVDRFKLLHANLLLPCEFYAVYSPILRAPVRRYSGDLPSTLSAIYGAKGPRGVITDAVTIEDDSDAVCLWKAHRGKPLRLDQLYGYIRLRLQPDSGRFGADDPDLAARIRAEAEKELLIDFGLCSGIRYETDQPGTAVGSLDPISSYTLKAETGTKTKLWRNPHHLNRMMAKMKGWVTLDEKGREPFPESRSQQVLQCIVRTIERCAHLEAT